MLQETVKSLYGTYRLALRDSGGMAYFNVSVDGFWRSFLAALLIAPLYMVLLYMRFNSGEVYAPVPRYVSVEAISYVISWTAFPVVMITLSKFLERGENYLAYIIAYNWAAVLQNGLTIPLAMLSLSGVLSDQVAGTFSLIVVALIFSYSWFIAVTALKVPAVTAVAVVALDFILGVFISVLAESML